MSESKSSSGGGIGLGSVLAMILSWMKWHSLGWLVIHAIFGWGYVFYYCFAYGLDI